MISVKIPPEAAGCKLIKYLSKQGYSIAADCGGKGTCGKCRVKMLSGSFYKDSEMSCLLEPDSDNYVKSCRAWCSEQGAEILIPEADSTDQITLSLGDSLEYSSADESAESVRYGIALDIGTTTLAMASIAIKDDTYEIIQTVSRLNPQRSFGADVMSRITAASEGQLLAMQEVLLSEIRSMIDSLRVKADIMTVVANPTMLHIFCGVSPERMGAYPFIPEFTDMKILTGSSLGLPVESVILLPSASAFIGADVIAGCLSVALTDNAQPVVLIDIGTNGEMMLYTGTDNGGKLYAASSAAGPAFEGAGITTGVGGIKGAVCAVELHADTLMSHTIGNEEAVGICGSGLIDLIAVLLARGDIDETGYLEESPVVYAHSSDRQLTITEQDVRAFQLAKSAIRAGLEALIHEAGLKVDDISKVYIAGGLGFYMNIDSSVQVGLIPASLKDKVAVVGNSALSGAMMFMLRDTIMSREAEKIATRCTTIELNSSEFFTNAFIEYMMFE